MGMVIELEWETVEMRKLYKWMAQINIQIEIYCEVKGGNNGSISKIKVKTKHRN